MSKNLESLERELQELRRARDVLSVHLDMTHSEKIAVEASKRRMEEALRKIEDSVSHGLKHYRGAVALKIVREITQIVRAALSDSPASADPEPTFDWNNTDGPARQRHIDEHARWAERQVSKASAAPAQQEEKKSTDFRKQNEKHQRFLDSICLVIEREGLKDLLIKVPGLKEYWDD
jgi:hypothetical protein